MEKSFRGASLVQHGKFTDSTVADFNVPAGAVKFYKGDIIFSGVSGSKYIGAKPATGNYGTDADAILGIASEDSTNSLTADHSHFEPYLLRQGQQWEIEARDKSLITTQAMVDSFKKKCVLFHYDAVTDKWTIDLAVADDQVNNNVCIVDADYLTGRVRFIYVR